MARQRRSLFVALSITLLIALPATAGVSIPGVNSVMGVETVVAPGSVIPGAAEGADPILFAEVIGGTIGTAGGLRVDHDGTDVVASPTISGNVVHPGLAPTTLSQGSLYNSYLLHFDPAGDPTFPPANYVSVIEFSSEVIGVQLFSESFDLDKPAGTSYTGTLEGGDVEVGTGITYPADASRGVEEDTFILAIDGKKVMIAGSAFGAEIDQIRIFTLGSHTPEPGALAVWLMVIGCCGLVHGNRASRHRYVPAPS